MLQNHIGELEYPVKGTMKSVTLASFKGASILKITLSQIAMILLAIGIIFAQDIPEYTVMGTTLFGILFALCGYYIYVQYRNKANEIATQQKKYYKWGNVATATPQQLEALQLIAFSRYDDGLWTDTLEYSPVEVRVKHISKFREKLNWFDIDTTDKEIAPWVASWGMNSQKKYEQLYNNLINGMHTPIFLLDYKAHPNWKTRILELTDISEDYFDACFTAANGKPKKLIWAWDLWRAITLSTAAFECGFITEKEAWEKIYRVSNISHYLFDNLEDFYKNLRLGHAYWCNNETQVYDRTLKIKSFLNPTKGTERRVHTCGWTVPTEFQLTDNMKDNFESHLIAIENEEKEKENENRNPIGFK